MFKCENPDCNNLIDEIKRIKRYCSRRCNNHHYLSLHYNKYNPKKLKHEQRCGNPKCNKVILTIGSKNCRKYCSEKCKSLAQYYREKDKPERRFKRSIRGRSLQISEIFIKSKGEKCEMCGATENLHIHHKKYTMNFDDWQLLCKKCHKKIHP